MTTLITHFLDCCASRRSFLTSLAAAGMGAAGGAVTGWAAEVAVSEVPSAGQPEEGSMYLFAHITLKPGTAQKFTEVLGEIAPCLRSTVAGSSRPVTSKLMVLRTGSLMSGRSRTPRPCGRTWTRHLRTLHSTDCAHGCKSVWSMRFFR